ncbi:hypothetical protein ABBQ38_003065 [Trebouxia sp. C0009 RCD-2024]
MKMWTCTAVVLVAAALEASAAGFQPSLNRAGNAVGATVTGRQWHEQKLASRIQGWQDCVQKYMSNRKVDAGAPQDPCFLDTGAGTALSHLSGRTLLQISNDIPNYAASATTAPAGTGWQVPQDAAVNQNPFASGKQASVSETPADAADAAPPEATAGYDSTGSKISPAPVFVEKPQPIGPDPHDFQQTKDFPPGTRLTHDQAALLLSGRGIHHGQ